MNTLLTSPPQAPAAVTLYYREGGSDKVYHASLEPVAEDLYVVHFAYGRRGTTLNTGAKTAAPVDYATAKAIYDKLVQSKRAKGYTPGPNGTPYQHTTNEPRVSGLLPQLLNPIEEDRLEHYLQDARYGLQEKFDGQRLLLKKEGGQITAINRRGLTIGMAASIVAGAMAMPADFILDGEWVGEVYHVFDLLALNSEDERSQPYQQRLHSLQILLQSSRPAPIEWVETAFTPDDKTRRLETLRQQNKEGVVFKRLDAPYTPGRPASGGPQLKYKFYATLSAVVARHNPQRSVEIRLLNKLGWQPAGNVTIPANQPVPPVGAVVEVRYLYAHRESGCLYQPTCLGIRSDIAVEDCLARQLKFKSANTDDEACITGE